MKEKILLMVFVVFGFVLAASAQVPEKTDAAKANARPAKKADTAEPFDGASVAKMAGQCVAGQAPAIGGRALPHREHRRRERRTRAREVCRERRHVHQVDAGAQNRASRRP